MKPIVTSLAAVAAMAGLFGCQPDQEYRLAEACRESMTFMVAPNDNALEKTCGCLAKAAVQQLDYDTVEFMIAMLKDPDLTMQDDTPANIARMEKIVEFQFGNEACMRPLTVS
jgi:hypothetical protein